jgi:hypothetical protein
MAISAMADSSDVRACHRTGSASGGRIAIRHTLLRFGYIGRARGDRPSNSAGVFDIIYSVLPDISQIRKKL